MQDLRKHIDEAKNRVWCLKRASCRTCLCVYGFAFTDSSFQAITHVVASKAAAAHCVKEALLCAL
jgi:hypothetical protein